MHISSSLKRSLPALLPVAALLTLAQPALAADYFCVNKKNYQSGKKVDVTVRQQPCGPKQLDITASLRGPQGEAGTPGADGQMRIYGDGSAGPLTISADTNLDITDYPNWQFTDITINAGATLTVRSGTVLRCTGTFTNNGTVSIMAFASGGRILGAADTTYVAAIRGANPGVAKAQAQNGAVTGTADEAAGGLGGSGVSETEASQILMPGPAAGGGSGAAGNGAAIGEFGSSGGGSLVVLCQTAIVNNGTINANGSGNSGGGGAGGIIVLASPTSVTNSAAGVISANGGNGEASDENEGASGGGGGGIVHFVSPVINIVNAANVTAAGGTAGSNAAAATAATRSGGGGGGACGGNGGAGGDVSGGGGDAAGAGSNGSAGYVLQTVADPTSLF